MTSPEEPLVPPARGGAGAERYDGIGGLRPPFDRSVQQLHDGREDSEEPQDEEWEEYRSLLEDLQALFASGKTYASAELNFQKTRASFAAGKVKSVAVFGIVAAVFAFLAAIGLTVGLILSLATLIGPLAATGVVVGVLLIIAALLARAAASRWNHLMSAFSADSERRP